MPVRAVGLWAHTAPYSQFVRASETTAETLIKEIALSLKTFSAEKEKWTVYVSIEIGSWPGMVAHTRMPELGRVQPRGVP